MLDSLALPGEGVHAFTSTVTDPFERGREFGAAFPGEVRRTIAFYRALLARCPNPDIDLAEHGALALDAIAAFSADAAAEIRGIADGAGVDVHEVAGINARTELLAIADPEGRVECSTIVSAPASGPAIGAQTWDWYTDMADNWLVWTIPLTSGRTMSTVTEFGILGKIGINSDGLGLLFSILHHEADGQGVGVPVHVLARTVLEQAQDVEAALAVVSGVELTASSTFSLLDQQGTAAVELFPGGRGVVRAEGGWLTRTNHFLSVEGAPGCVDHVTGVNSPTRLADLHRYVTADARREPAGLVAALTGHDPAGPLCSHASDTDTGSTLATVLIDTVAPSVTVWRGWPCQTPLAP